MSPHIVDESIEFSNEREIMDERPTYEQKLKAASELRDLPPEQVLNVLDSLNRNWYNYFFGSGTKKTIDCVLPKNEHQRDDTQKYICGDTNTGPHSYCLYHDLVKDKCPIDGTDLTQVPA